MPKFNIIATLTVQILTLTLMLLLDCGQIGFISSELIKIINENLKCNVYNTQFSCGFTVRISGFQQAVWV